MFGTEGKAYSLVSVHCIIVLKFPTNVILCRDTVTAVMHEFADDGFEKHMPTLKQIPCSPLTSIRPDEEWLMDGHDKLWAAGFDIYGVQEKWLGRWHHCQVIPSNCYAVVVGVIQLECIKKVGGTWLTLLAILMIELFIVIGMAVQGSTDRGSEVRDAFSIFTTLR